MRYAIVSDLHANRQAWASVLADIEAQGVDEIVCLGDVVGYGPCPQRVLNAVRGHTVNFVLGNHDAAAAGLMDPAIFNDHARAVIEWTRDRLDDDARAFLASVPLSIEAGEAFFVHAEIAEPSRFHYVETVESAAEQFAAMAPQHRIAFLGHTHDPTGWVHGPEGVYQVEDQDFQLQQGFRYIVNVGSVGEPRDPEEVKARYVIYDAEHQQVFFRRADFDCAAYRADLVESGLAIKPYFLSVLDHEAAAAQRTEHLFVEQRGRVLLVSNREVNAKPRQLVVSEVEAPTAMRRKGAGAAGAADKKRPPVVMIASIVIGVVTLLAVLIPLIIGDGGRGSSGTGETAAQGGGSAAGGTAVADSEEDNGIPPREERDWTLFAEIEEPIYLFGNKQLVIGGSPTRGANGWTFRGGEDLMSAQGVKIDEKGFRARISFVPIAEDGVILDLGDAATGGAGLYLEASKLKFVWDTGEGKPEVFYLGIAHKGQRVDASVTVTRHNKAVGAWFKGQQVLKGKKVSAMIGDKAPRSLTIGGSGGEALVADEEVPPLKGVVLLLSVAATNNMQAAKDREKEVFGSKVLVEPPEGES